MDQPGGPSLLITQGSSALCCPQEGWQLCWKMWRFHLLFIRFSLYSVVGWKSEAEEQEHNSKSLHGFPAQT